MDGHSGACGSYGGTQQQSSYLISDIETGFCSKGPTAPTAPYIIQPISIASFCKKGSLSRSNSASLSRIVADEGNYFDGSIADRSLPQNNNDDENKGDGDDFDNVSLTTTEDHHIHGKHNDEIQSESSSVLLDVNFVFEDDEEQEQNVNKLIDFLVRSGSMKRKDTTDEPVTAPADKLNDTKDADAFFTATEAEEEEGHFYGDDHDNNDDNRFRTVDESYNSRTSAGTLTDNNTAVQSQSNTATTCEIGTKSMKGKCLYSFGKILALIPWFTLAETALIWIFYVGGVFKAYPSWKEAHVTASGPLSPDIESFWFITVNFWPSCTSAKSNTWRLISHQFAHQGMYHIISNTLWLTSYGATLDAIHPLKSVASFCVFQVAVIVGALYYSYIWPYKGLVGCSAGVYGLIGLLIAHVIVHKDIVAPVTYALCSVAVICQFIGDVVMYFVFYNPDVAYAAHCGGFTTGILLGLGMSVYHNRTVKWKVMVGTVAGAMFIAFLTFFTVQYIVNWPPKLLKYSPVFYQAPYQPYSYSYDPGSCCAELNALVGTNDNAGNYISSLDSVRGLYYCDGRHIIRNGQSD
jgi:membrane associated rhomboid family serine protease